MYNTRTESRILKLAIVLVSFSQMALVGCGSRGSGPVIFTIENATDQQIQKVTIPGFDPMSRFTIGPIGEGETKVAAPTASFAIELPQSCEVAVVFADGTTSEINVAVGSEVVPNFTGKLAFTIRASDNIELIVSSD